MKYEFASREWFAALHAIFCERAAIAATTDPDFRTSTCEVFTNPPGHLLAPGRTELAWRCRIRGAEVDFALEESDEVETKIIGDYATLVPLAHYIVGGDPAREAELEGLLGQAVAAGKIKVVRRSTAASPLGSVHDAICKLTA